MEKIDCGCNDPRLEIEFHAGGGFVAIKGCPHREKPEHAQAPKTYRICSERDGKRAEFIVSVYPITHVREEWENRELGT